MGRTHIYVGSAELLNTCKILVYVRIHTVQIYSGITCGKVLNGELYVPGDQQLVYRFAVFQRINADQLSSEIGVCMKILLLNLSWAELH